MGKQLESVLLVVFKCMCNCTAKEQRGLKQCAALAACFSGKRVLFLLTVISGPPASLLSGLPRWIATTEFTSLRVDLFKRQCK